MRILVVVLVIGLTLLSACTVVHRSPGTNLSQSPGDDNEIRQSSNIGTRTYGDTISQLFLEIENNTDIIINRPGYSTKEKERAEDIREEVETIKKELSQDLSIDEMDKKSQLARLMEETNRIIGQEP